MCTYEAPPHDIWYCSVSLCSIQSVGTPAPEVLKFASFTTACFSHLSCVQAATPTYYDGAYHAYVRARLKCHIHYLARSSFDQILDLAAVVFFIFYKYFPITYQEYMASRAASITQRPRRLLWFSSEGVLDRRDVLDLMHGRSRMTIDPRIPTRPGRSMSGFHQPGRDC